MNFPSEPRDVKMDQGDAEAGAAVTPVTLESWLSSLDLGELVYLFQAQGYDMQLIQAQGLDEGDLAAIGVTKRGSVKKLLAAAREVKEQKRKNEGKRKWQSDDEDPLPSLHDEALGKLVSFCTQNMRQTLDANRAGSYLELALKYGEKDLASQCLSFIETQPLPVFSSTGFLFLSPPTVDRIIQSPNLDLEEVVIFQALLRWKLHAKERSLAPLLKHIRFGAISPQDLLRVVEPLKVATEDQLLAAYRFHACPNARDQFANDPFYTSRKKTPASLTPSAIPPPYEFGFGANFLPSSVGGIPGWKLTMSSKYPDLPNSYESLVDDNPNHPGCATDYETNVWVMATFQSPTLVKRVRLSAPTLGAFSDQGWGGGGSAEAYLVGIEIQSSNDEREWTTQYQVKSAKSSGFVDCDFKKPAHARHFRLFKKSGYIATGSFILE